MALEQNEIKKVINVDLGNTTTSLKDYKKHIDDLRASLLGLDSSSEEYAKIAQQIKNEQDKLNEVMKVGKKNTDAADGSYDKLVQTMADLKKQWRATADETERADIGKQILDINNQLKDLDASTGNYQRNVGDYSNSFKEAFNSLPGPIGNVSKGVSGLGTQLKALLANPIVAIVGAITAAIGVLTKSIKGNEDQMMALKEAFAVFEPVINLVKNAITQFAQGVVNVFTKVSDTITTFVGWIGRQARNLGFDEFADKIEKFEQMQKTSKEMAAEENRLTKENRQLQLDIASTQTKISELKLKANQADKYSQVERKKFLEEANKLEIAASEKTIALRQREYELIKWKNEQAQNSTKDYEAENQALIAVTNAQTELNNKLGGTARRISSLSKAAQDGVKEVQDKIERSATTVPKISFVETPEQVSTSFDAAFNAYKEKVKGINESASHEETMLKLTADTLDPATVLQQEYDIQQSRIRAQIAANMEILANEQLTNDERTKILLEQDELKARLAQNDRKYATETANAQKKASGEAIEDWMEAFNGISSSAGDLFGALADLSEENSTEQKAFAILETTINTLKSIMATIAGAAGGGPAAWVAAGLQVAANIATGIATIQKITNTTKENASSQLSGAGSSVTTPGAQMTSVAPLLDEQADINRLEAGRAASQSQQNMRVYVVEQDIRDARERVDVREANATF